MYKQSLEYPLRLAGASAQHFPCAILSKVENIARQKVRRCKNDERRVPKDVAPCAHKFGFGSVHQGLLFKSNFTERAHANQKLERCELGTFWTGHPVHGVYILSMYVASCDINGEGWRGGH